MPNSTKQQEINRRRSIIAKLRSQGIRRQQDITERLKEDYQIEVTRQTISNDLKALDRQWQQEALAETAGLKAEVTQNYWYLYAEAIQGWQRSLENKEVQIQESIESSRKIKEKDKGAGGERIKAQLRTEGQSGNPALLAQAQGALKAIRELWGLDMPTKISLSWQKEVADMLKAGLITEQDILDEFGGDIAQDFFESVGLNFAGIGEVEEEGPAE